MKFSYNGQEADSEGIYFVKYGNDILNGVLIDLPEQYAFLSEHVEGHREFIETVQAEEEVDYFDMEDCEVDYSVAPHSWVVSAVSQLVIKAAEQACREAEEEA